jgi:tRNA-splicing ligase RtcB
MKEQKLKGKYTDAILYTENAEYSCIEQIKGMINSPAFTEPVRIMPDTHAGKGSVVGFTMPVGDKLVPNTIGVDIGCGIYAYKIEGVLLKNGQGWKEIDDIIKKNVPLGFKHRGNYKETIEELENKIPGITTLAEKLDIKTGALLSQLGTLGGGNHFIEIATSTNDTSLWLLIHTGSRNLGKRTCDLHQNKAIVNLKVQRDETIKQVLARTPAEQRQDKMKEIKEMEIFNVSNDQAWLEHEDKNEYLNDMYIAQKFAHLNKLTIRDAICDALNLKVVESIESVHNYIDPNDNVIRKGAIKAYDGEAVVIPFNMRDGSILARGKGNVAWNNSAPHGAGRIMSRSQAKREVKLEDFEATMVDVWSSSVNNNTLDESPFAYKPREEIEDAIVDTVDVYDYLVPVYNLKDGTK